VTEHERRSEFLRDDGDKRRRINVGDEAVTSRTELRSRIKMTAAINASLVVAAFSGLIRRVNAVPRTKRINGVCDEVQPRQTAAAALSAFRCRVPYIARRHMHDSDAYDAWLPPTIDGDIHRCLAVAGLKGAAWNWLGVNGF